MSTIEFTPARRLASEVRYLLAQLQAARRTPDHAGYAYMASSPAGAGRDPSCCPRSRSLSATPPRTTSSTLLLESL